MAEQLNGGKITMDGTAKTLSTWLSYTAKQHACRVTFFKADASNAAAVYFSNLSTVTSAGANATMYLNKGESWTIDHIAMMSPDTIYIVGTNNDNLWVSFWE